MSWTAHYTQNRDEPTSITRLLAAIVGIPCTILFGGLVAVLAIAGDGQAAVGAALLGVMVAASAALIVLVVWGVATGRRQRRARHEYERGLIARFDQAAAQLAWPQPAALPDAAQMRQQAWQPDLHDGAAAVRPTNPAPWHVVTQYPTQQFHSPDGEAQ